MNKVNCFATLNTLIYILTKNGFLFTGKISKLDTIKIVLNLTIAITTDILIIFNIKNAFETNDMNLVNWMICILLPMLHYLFKGICLLINKKCLMSLLEIIKSDIFNNHSERLNRHIRLVDRVSGMILKYFAIAAVVVIIVFCILPFAINMKMMVPPPFKTGRFDIVYKLIHLVFVTYFGTNTACFDVFYMTLMALGMAQLNILKEQLLNVWETAKHIQNATNKNINDITRNILGNCITLHKTIIGYVEKLNSLLAFPLSIQYISGCFIICNTVLQMTIMGDESNTTAFIGLGGYTCITFAQMAIYHWLANEILFKSNKIIESCYTSTWYEMNVRDQKSLIFIMERSRKPLTTQLYNVINISLESLGVIIRWSYSIFALIKARYN